MAMFRRKRWFHVLGIVVVVAFAARIALRAAEPTTTLPSPLTPGTFTLVMKSGGYDRVAQIHIPPGYKADKKPPLVLLLHGGGGGATHTGKRRMGGEGGQRRSSVQLPTTSQFQSSSAVRLSWNLLGEPLPTPPDIALVL
jgi:hypothetical protein